MKTVKQPKYTRNDSNLLTSADVCELLNISTSTLTKWLNDGEIRILTKVGGMNYFSKKDLNKRFNNELFYQPC